MSRNPKIVQPPALPPTGSAEKQPEKRGLFERLGDKILQRLARTAVADGEAYFAPEPHGATVTVTAGVAPRAVPRVRSFTRPAGGTPPSGGSTRATPVPDAIPVTSSPSQTRPPYISRVNRRVPPAIVPGLPISLAPKADVITQPERRVAKSKSATPASSLFSSQKQTVSLKPELRTAVARAPTKPQPSQPQAASRRALRVCFLEDSCTSSHAIRETLQDQHHSVDHFSSAEEALDAIMEKPYDIVLASQIVALGGMDSAGLIRAVRSTLNAAKRNIPIVVITANADSSNIESFYIAGASDVVVKPVEGRDLHQRLVQTVDTLIARDVAPERRPEPRPVTRQSRRLKICFLEDSCTSSHAIRETLGDRGYEVDHFSGAEEAFDALMEKRYDAVLASQIVSVGGMDCEALIRKLRHSPAADKRSLPVVAITANAEPANVQRFFAAGANDVVLKPVEGFELDERIQTTVRARSPAASGQAKLPRVSQPLTTPPAPAVRNAGSKGARLRRLKVCFLEDSCTSSHAIRETLGDVGHEVDHFSIPEEALDAFLEKDYQILLASQTPGSATGLDTASLIRRVRNAPDLRRRNTPVVVLTTDGSLENRHAMISIGANDLVVKPVQGNLGEYLVHIADGATRALAVPERPRPATTPQVDVAARRVPNRLRVCFLEDSCTSSHAIREMLGEAGHEVDHFSGPEEALDALHEKPYDVLLASQIVAIGGLDCVSLIEAIRNGQHPDKRSIGIIAITANPEPANLQSFRNAGADAVIVKPIEGNLSERIKNILRTRPIGGSRPRPPSATRANATVSARATATQSVSRAAAEAMSPSPRGTRQPDLARAIGDLNQRRGGTRTDSAAAPLSSTPRPSPAPPTQPARQQAAPEVRRPAQANGRAAVSGGATAPSVPALRLPNKIPPYRAGARRKSSASILVYGVVLAAVIFMATTSWRHMVGDTAAVNISRVEVGEIYRTIPASGRVVSKRKVEIIAPAAGQITGVRVREGELVRKEQILATMDRRDTDITLQRAEAQLESAKKDVALAQRTLDRLIRALQMGAVSRQMAEDAEAALHASQARQRVAAEEVKAARLASTRTEIKAPFSGTVLAAFAVEGAWTEPPTPLFTLVNMNEREIEIRTEATNAASIEVGQKVSLRSDTFPDRQWIEEVTRIAPGTSRDTNSGISNSVSVFISLGRKAPDLLFGQQVDAEIRLAATPKALKVPFNAISNQDGKTVVAVLDAGRVHFVPVVTGIESATHVQIKEGVKRGQRVILNSRNLKQGQKVEVAELPG